MSGSWGGHVARLLGFVVAVVLPLLAFLLASRRELQIGTAFLVNELSGLQSVGGLALMVLPLAAIGLLQMRSRHQSSLLGISVRQGLARSRLLLVGIALVSIVLTGIYLKERFRHFSETSFQRRAVAALEAGEIAGARSVCGRYVTLFPQRRRDGTFPDPICSPIFEFSESMAALHAFVASQSPVPWTVDQMTIGVEPLAQTRALEILREWSGR